MKANDMSADPLRAWTLIWHGSEISQITVQADGTLTLSLSVACVQTADGTEGHLTGTTLTWPHAHCQTDADLSDLLGSVSDGRWQLEGRSLRTMPIPSVCTQPHSLELRLASGGDLCVIAHECHISVAPDCRFQESLAC